ncbi:MAG TPA: SusC/RagA family TonB-linked outer membrane protein, partial [Pricia antarctica]|nr:SusC/RagA family TonB-linked outer membrane protein [Pricia antarctica]
MIKLKMAVLMLLMAFTQTLLSQTTVTGTVSDQEGVPLPGATVVVEGTSNGTTTDFDGQYELDNVATEDRLTFSYIGMSPQTVNVGTQSEINISLAEDTQALDEVVVVGYGQQSRADVTGAISTVDSEDITATPVTNAEQALQGRAAGVTITNSSSPGSSPNVRIRGLGTVGNNEPLYVIDGVITGGLSGINPSDIESVSVLKDASTTAIYGSQGSNGVIVVTTKKGTKQKGELSFNTYTGYQTNTKRYDVLNTSQYLQYANALGVIPARDPNIFNNNTDWQDQIYTSGVIQDHNLSYSGGGESSNYRFSMGYLSQDGAVINTGFDRYSFRANSSFSFGKLTVGETMAVTFSKQDPLL